MNDPIGALFGRLFSAAFGYVIGTHQTRRREDIDRLNDERIQAVANRVYTRMYAMLAKAKVGTKGQQFRLADILGNPELSRFSMEVAGWVRRELQQQP
jgi:hypothetical protein